ncbi:MAG TPA: PDZ domain-containing protein [Cerasibacillus sp.]|uniref:PDZ domain-containing protein n=1 Tax=Cerasibacillus sp. TaxID=2498711 RepID=UPI002F41C7A3
MSVLLNPLLYWFILLIMISSYIRVRSERSNYGRKVFPMLSEISHTWIITVVASIILSIFIYLTGIYITFETVMLISVITVILSFNYSYIFLSPSYTLGFSFLIILLYAKLGVDNSRFPVESVSGWLILIGMLLIVEAFLFYSVKRNQLYPEIFPSYRGLWLNQLYIRRLMFMPFIIFIPSGTLETTINLSTELSSFNLALFPFFIGLNEAVEKHQGVSLAKKKAKFIALLGVIVMALAIVSYLIPWFTWIVIFIAIIGRIFIHKYVKADTMKSYYFALKDKLKVLMVIRGSYAERLGIESGDEIKCVNGVSIKNMSDFKKALNMDEKMIQIEAYNQTTKINKQIKRAINQKDKQNLGIIFITTPFIKRK